MASSFLLLDTEPGREAEVLERLAGNPIVTMKRMLWRGAIAVRVEGPPEAWASVLTDLRAAGGVTGTRVYPVRNA